MNIILDNIIFSLQSAGGISVVWEELLSGLILDQGPEYLFLNYEGCTDNIFWSPEYLKYGPVCGRRQLERYRSPGIIVDRPAIFHSSYYRYVKSDFVANVVTVHDFTYEFFRSGLPRMVHHRQKKDAIFSADAIICVSENTRNDLLRLEAGIDPSKVFTVYNGVSGQFHRIEKGGRMSDPLPFENGRYILYVGDRKARYKNFDAVINALGRQTAYALVIVGGGRLTSKEVLMMDSVIGRTRYNWAGIVSDERLNELYNGAFALVYPSLYEGFGLPVLEAQKAGCPVIAANTSCLPEIAGGGAILLDDVSGLSVAEALERLLDRERCDFLVGEGFVNAAEYSWSRMVAEVKHIYKDLMLRKFGMD